jgi:hypothetical protein
MTRTLARTRMHRLSRLAIIALGLILLAPAARAGDTTVTRNQQSGTIDGKGGVVKILGNQNTYTIRNASKVSVLGNQNTLTLEACAALDLMGNKNTIKAGPVKSISVMGSNNTITYPPGPRGEKPAISNVGNGNKIDPARQGR